MPCIDFSNENRIIVQKGVSKKDKKDFSFHERKTFYRNVPDVAKFLSTKV